MSENLIEHVVDGRLTGWRYKEGPVFWYNANTEDDADKARNHAFEWGDCMRVMQKLTNWSAETLRREEARVQDEPVILSFEDAQAERFFPIVST